MIANDQQLQTTLERIAWFQQQVAHLRRTEGNPVNYRAAASGSWRRSTACNLKSESTFASFHLST